MMAALGFGLVAAGAYIGCFFCMKSLQKCSHDKDNHPEDIFNISSRVQGQALNNPRLSNDAFVTIEHINATNQMNNKPVYDEPPSYEEAMRIQQLNADRPAVHSNRSQCVV